MSLVKSKTCLFKILNLSFSSNSRIDKPIYRNGKILTITEKDWKDINFQIKREYSLSPLQSMKQNDKKIAETNS